MKSVNKAILIGNLGRDPELRYTAGGTPVANFSIATTERYKQDGEWQEKTEWHNLVCWRRLAEIAGEYLRKGSRVYIEGKITTRSWESDGKKNYRTEVVVDNLMMLDSKGGGGDTSDFEPENINDDDIPF